MVHSFKIVNKYYWKSLFGPGLMFVFSILYMFINTSIWDIASQMQPFVVLPNIFCGMILLITMLCIPVTINSLRTSMIMKRIGASKITSLQFITVVILYYYVVTLIGYLWYIACGFLVFCNRVDDYINILKMINVPCLLYSTTISFLLGVTFGLFVLIFTKRNYVISLVAVLLFLAGSLLAPYESPIGSVHDITPIFDASTQELTKWSKSTLYYFVYFDPFRYTTRMSYEAFFSQANTLYNFLGSNIFNPTEELQITSIAMAGPHVNLTEVDKWLNIFLPPFFITMFAISDAKMLEWSVRS